MPPLVSPLSPPTPAYRPKLQATGSSSGGLDDEYGEMDRSDKIFEAGALTLESGLIVPNTRVAYRTWGALNEARDNVVFISHALTGNAAVDSWWGVLLGEGRAFDSSKYFIVCANMLGSCYGTTGPNDPLPDPPPSWVAPRAGTHRAAAGARYAADFPYCTVRDTVSLHYKLLVDHLQVNSLHAVIGGSAGGMQALEWAIMYPSFVRRVVAMACGATQSPWQIGISESQRQAIYRDPNWNDGFYHNDSPPSDGLANARQQAMVWYRSQQAYDKKFGRQEQPASPGGVAERANLSSGGGPSRESSAHNGGANVTTTDVSDGSWGFEGGGAPPTYAVEAYLEHQGVKFLERFDANTYIALTKLIDSHDVGRDRGGVDKALATVACPVLVIGLASDVLYPIEMQKELADKLPRGCLRIVQSIQGHDGFLLEGGRIGAMVTGALEAEEGADMESSLLSDSGINAGTSSLNTSEDEATVEESDHDRTLRETLALPSSMTDMNKALAEFRSGNAGKKKSSGGGAMRLLTPAQEWFYGI